MIIVIMIIAMSTEIAFIAYIMIMNQDEDELKNGI